MGLGRVAAGLGCAALLFVTGLISAVAGVTTCHENVQSADRAPRLCATAGNGVALSVSAVLGPALAVVLLLVSARRRTIGFFTAAIVVADVALFAMWALVSHGTIRF